MRVTWLPDVLRAAGLTVVEVPGWRGRGKELTAINGVVGHHTATGTNWTDQRVVDLLRVGREDLPGPLAQLGLARDGTFYVVADGKANHNGYGTWGNQAVGIEAFNAGDGKDPWPRVQVDAYQRGAAAILTHEGLKSSRFKGHRETDPKRKPDPRGIDLDAFRNVVDVLLGHPDKSAPIAPPKAPAPKENPLSALTDAEQRELINGVRRLVVTSPTKPYAVRDKRDGKVWIIDGGTRSWVENATALDMLIFTGQVQGWGSEGVAIADPVMLDGIPVA